MTDLNAHVATRQLNNQPGTDSSTTGHHRCSKYKTTWAFSPPDGTKSTFSFSTQSHLNLPFRGYST
jgi:hypothetical protein